jgi:hypothetical protein
MNTNNNEGRMRPEALDADAVCAQCNTVNSEGTLLCKTCGNNLRDQRSIRLAADQAMDLERTGHRRKTWVSALMFLIAIGVIVATLLNQEQIVEWMIDADAGTVDPAELWEGDAEARFAPMLEALEAAGVNEEAARAALSAGGGGDVLDGAYAIFVGDDYLGAGYAQFDGTELYFVALLDSGEEIRGRAEPRGNYYAAMPENAAFRRGSRLGEVRGVAMPQGNGVVECIGDYGNEQLSFIAYRLPAQ